MERYKTDIVPQVDYTDDYAVEQYLEIEELCLQLLY